MRTRLIITFLLFVIVLTTTSFSNFTQPICPNLAGAGVYKWSALSITSWSLEGYMSHC